MGEVNWPFAQGHNISINRAEGVYLYDDKDRQILDAAGGAIVANIGHGRERVARAVYAATRDYSYVVPPWVTPSRSAMVAELERNWLPPELCRIHVTSGGSDSVEGALKLALQYQAAIGQGQRGKIISRQLSYHGTTLTTTAVSGHAARKRGLEAALLENPKAETPYPLRCPLGRHHPDAAQYYLRELRTTIEREGADQIAAFVGEPIVGSSGGAIVPPVDYWPGVRALCDEYGIVLINDEVMTGFGRTGKNFGYQHWDYTPDILVAGKGLAGGYAPLGGVFATEQIGAAIAEAGYQVMFHTFGAHPAACAAAAEVLAILTEEDLVARVAVMGEKLQRQLQETFGSHSHVAEVRGQGLLQAIEIVANRDTLETFPEAANLSGQIVSEALKRGVFFYGGGTGSVRDIICLGPPFIVAETHLEQMCSVLAESVDAVIARLRI